MQTLQKIDEFNFIGMNDRYPSHLLTRGLFSVIQNATIDQDKILKRKGTNPIAASIGNQAILGAIGFQPVSGTKYLIVDYDGASNAQIYYWTGSGTFTALGSANLTAGAQMNFVQASNIIYGFNGTDVVSVDSSLTITKNPATVPQGQVAAWFHNYLFVANTASFPNRVFWSDLGNPTNFTNTNFIDINPNDGDQITALAVFNDELYVFKNNTIWSITGFSGSTFSTTTVLGQNTNNRIYGYGTPSQKSVIIAGRDMFYMSFSGGTPHFRSFNQTQFATSLDQGVVSSDIETTMQGISQSNLAKVAGIYDGKYIYWGVPNGASTFNNLILAFYPVIRTKAALTIHRSWVKWVGFNPSCFATSNLTGAQVIYFGDGTATGNISQMNYSTYADNGTPVSMTVQTRDFQLDKVREAKWKYLYTTIQTGSAGNLTISGRVNQSVNFTLQQIEPLAGSSPTLGSFILGSSTLGGQLFIINRTPLQQLTGYMCGIQFLETSANSCQIDNFSLLGRLKGYRDTS